MSSVANAKDSDRVGGTEKKAAAIIANAEKKAAEIIRNAEEKGKAIVREHADAIKQLMLDVVERLDARPVQSNPTRAMVMAKLTPMLDQLEVLEEAAPLPEGRVSPSQIPKLSPASMKEEHRKDKMLYKRIRRASMKRQKAEDEVRVAAEKQKFAAERDRKAAIKVKKAEIKERDAPEEEKKLAEKIRKAAQMAQRATSLARRNAEKRLREAEISRIKVVNLAKEEKKEAQKAKDALLIKRRPKHPAANTIADKGK